MAETLASSCAMCRVSASDTGAGLRSATCGFSNHVFRLSRYCYVRPSHPSLPSTEAVVVMKPRQHRALVLSLAVHAVSEQHRTSQS